MSDEATGIPTDAATPTEILTPQVAQPPAPQKEGGPSKRLLIILLIVLGVMVLVLGGILAMFLLRGGSADAAPAPASTQSTAPGDSSATDPDTAPSAPATEPAAKPTVKPTTKPAPKPTAKPAPKVDTVIVSFTGPDGAGCAAEGTAVYKALVDVTLMWQTRNAKVIALGVGTADAIDNPYEPALGANGSLTLTYSCSNPNARYTLTVAGADGKHISKTITVSNPSYGK